VMSQTENNLTASTASRQKTLSGWNVHPGRSTTFTAIEVSRQRRTSQGGMFIEDGDGSRHQRPPRGCRGGEASGRHEKEATMARALSETIDKASDKASDDILYRFYGPYSGRAVSLCEHLRRELDEHLEEMIGIGAMVKLTKVEAEAISASTGVLTMMPVDLTEEERVQFVGVCVLLRDLIEGAISLRLHAKSSPSLENAAFRRCS
jgi:hypothetical protein